MVLANGMETGTHAERIVITGTGMKTCIGNNAQQCFEALCQGHSGVDDIQIFDRQRFTLRQAYEIKDRPTGEDRKLRASEWLVQVINEAIEQAGLTPNELSGVPILVGTGLRELRSLELWHDNKTSLDIQELDFSAVLTKAFPKCGPVTTVSNACSAGNFCLGMAMDMMQLGDAKKVIVAATDAIAQSMFAFTDKASKEGLHAVQPFDTNRKGVLLGEGAAAVVMEVQGKTDGIKANALCNVLGVGMTCDAHHETAPSLEGLLRAMKDAYQRSGIPNKQIDLILAHGTGTTLNDENEACALSEVFAQRHTPISMTAIKSMLGHTSGGAALMSLIVAIQSLQAGVVPPTLGLTSAINLPEHIHLTPQKQFRSMRVAQVNASGFGGVNAIAIIERHQSC